MPSAEQTDCPAVVHEALELPAGAEAVGAILGEAAEGATEGAVAGTLDGAAGALELSEGAAAAAAAAAAAEGATAATFSCTTGVVGKAAEGIVAAAAAAAAVDDEGCTTDDDPLDCPVVLSLSPEPPGTVQPIGVHSMPCTLPLPFGAIVLNKSSGTSMLSNAQPSQVSVTVAIVSVPVVGLWIEICLLQMGLLFGLPRFDIMRYERATIASPFWLLMPQEPGEILGSAAGD